METTRRLPTDSAAMFRYRQANRIPNSVVPTMIPMANPRQTRRRQQHPADPAGHYNSQSRCEIDQLLGLGISGRAQFPDANNRPPKNRSDPTGDDGHTVGHEEPTNEGQNNSTHSIGLCAGRRPRQFLVRCLRERFTDRSRNRAAPGRATGNRSENKSSQNADPESRKNNGIGQGVAHRDCAEGAEAHEGNS